MTHVPIRIQSLEDAAKGVPLFPELSHPNQNELAGFGILEGGTEQGKLAKVSDEIVEFDPDNKSGIAEALSNLIEAK